MDLRFRGMEARERGAKKAGRLVPSSHLLMPDVFSSECAFLCWGDRKERVNVTGRALPGMLVVHVGSSVFVPFVATLLCLNDWHAWAKICASQCGGRHFRRRGSVLARDGRASTGRVAASEARGLRRLLAKLRF